MEVQDRNITHLTPLVRTSEDHKGGWDQGPTDWGELGRTERTGDVVHVGRGHLPLASLASCFATVWDLLLSGFDSSVEKGDGGGGGGGGGEDGFTVDCRTRE